MSLKFLKENTSRQKPWSKKRGDTSKRHYSSFSQKVASGESGLCLFDNKFTSIDERNLSIIE